jgi:hypothetical protein
MNNFVVFILSHGRPNNVITLKTLQSQGYTGEYYIIIDNEDKTADQYYKNFGEDRVIMFDKKDMASRVDSADNFNDRRVVMYARNACFEIAEKLGKEYFLELDDDYRAISHRWEDRGKLKQKHFKNLDKLFSLMLDYYRKNENITCLALSQGGDFIGGAGGTMYKNRIKRKAMNALLLSTKRKINFLGRINEDVNTYTTLGSRGQVFLTIADAMIDQLETQTNPGGMTDIYLSFGTYLKSFYSVMHMPNAVTIKMMRTSHPRLHHSINWEICVPKIVSGVYKKI